MLRLENLIDAKVEAMFHDTHPANSPTDLIAGHRSCVLHRCARLCSTTAVAGWDDQKSSSSTTTPTRNLTGDRSSIGDSRVDFPERVLDVLAGRATTFTIVVSQRGNHRRGREVNAGCTSWLPTCRPPAIAGAYSTCANPGYHVRYSRTK